MRSALLALSVSFLALPALAEPYLLDELPPLREEGLSEAVLRALVEREGLAELPTANDLVSLSKAGFSQDFLLFLVQLPEDGPVVEEPPAREEPLPEEPTWRSETELSYEERDDGVVVVSGRGTPDAPGSPIRVAEPVVISSPPPPQVVVVSPPPVESPATNVTVLAPERPAYTAPVAQVPNHPGSSFGKTFVFPSHGYGYGYHGGYRQPVVVSPFIHPAAYRQPVRRTTTLRTSRGPIEVPY